MRKCGRPLLAALLACLACALAPATASAARGMELAVQDDVALAEHAHVNQASLLNDAAALGASRLRVNILWGAIVGPSQYQKTKPANVVYDFTVYDGLLRAARARGIKLQLTLTGPAPAWATADRKRGVYRPSSKYYAEFVAAVVRHFRGQVDRYALMNEPNHTAWLKPLKEQASLYRSLYKAGYAAVKREDPSALVLIGETAPYVSKKGIATPPLKFLRDVLCVDSKYKVRKKCGLKADGYAHHPYDFDHAPTYKFPGADNVTLGTLSRLTKALDRLAANGALTTPAGKRLDVYLTEFGYFASGKRKVSRSRHASYLVQAFDIAQRNKRVRQMLQYLLLQATGPHAFFDTAIIKTGGVKLPAYNALAAWAAAARLDGRIVGPAPF